MVDITIIQYFYPNFLSQTFYLVGHFKDIANTGIYYQSETSNKNIFG